MTTLLRVVAWVGLFCGAYLMVTLIIAMARADDDGAETLDNIVCREVDGDSGGFYTCPLIGTMGRLFCPADDAEPCYYVATNNCRPPRTLVCRPAWVWEQAKQ